MCFIARDSHEVHGKELVDLEYLAFELVFTLNCAAYFFGWRDNDVIARGSRTKGIMAGAHTTDSTARHPNPRSANFSQRCALFLRESARPVLVELDRAASRDSQMDIKLAMEILQMAVTIYEARQNGLASDIDH